MILEGSVHRFGENISTDHIVPPKYFFTCSVPELVAHVLETADPNFASRVKTGDFIVAGRDFGIGSSREVAPLVIKLSGIAAVLAPSFPRIFFRNAINIGLPVLICDTANIVAGDRLKVDLATGKILVVDRGVELQSHPLAREAIQILNDGGLLAHIKKHGDFSFQ